MKIFEIFGPEFWAIITVLLASIPIAIHKKKHGWLTPYEKRLRKKWEAEKAAEEAAKAAQQPQEPRHYMSQAEYDQYKREHGIK